MEIVEETSICHGSRDRSGGYGFPPKLDVCDRIDEDIAEIMKTDQNREVRELGRDILALAAGVVIGIVIWFVVLKGGAD